MKQYKFFVVWPRDLRSVDAARVDSFFEKYGVQPLPIWEGSPEEASLRRCAAQDYDARMVSAEHMPNPFIALEDGEGKIVWAEGNPPDNGLLYAYQIMVGEREPGVPMGRRATA